MPGIPRTPNPAALPSFARGALAGLKGLYISGLCRDADGLPIAGATVKLYRTDTDTVAYTTTSDALGLYSFYVPGSGAFYIVAYKPGGTDVAGTTRNDLAQT